jgi:uncharacterized protein (TIGR03086 family)
VTTPDGFVALGGANAAFEQRLRLVGADDWQRPTPCSEWDVHALVNHVIGGNRRYRMLLRGASAASVDRTRTEDHLGPDPVAAFTTTARELAAAFREDGALSRIAHHPIGDRTGAELFAMRVLDVTVHAWDLARALDVDDTLDPEAVEFALAHTQVIEAGREHGSFTIPTSTSPPAPSTQARLLHLAGRSLEGDRS